MGTYSTLVGTGGYERLRPLSYPGTDVFLVCFTVQDSVVQTAPFTNISALVTCNVYYVMMYIEKWHDYVHV